MSVTQEVLAEAIRLIGDVIANVRGKRQTAGIGAAADALVVIGAIVESVQEGRLDKMTPDQARDELDHLRRTLEQSDAAADRALEDKFDKGGDD